MKKLNLLKNTTRESGKIGYAILYLMGAPVGLLIVLWLVLGNNIFGVG
jgi:hypothetical protein